MKYSRVIPQQLFFFFILTFAFTSIANGETWTQLSPTGGPPAVRSYPTSVYDPGSNRMIIYGGSSGSHAGSQVGDVWVLENANGQGGTPRWTQLSPSGLTERGRRDVRPILDLVMRLGRDQDAAACPQ